MDLKTQEDFNLVNLLLKNPLYRIPEHLRDKVLACAEKTIDDPYNKTADKLAATRTVLLADQMNLKMINMVMPKRTYQEVNIRKIDTRELIKLAEAYVTETKKLKELKVLEQ